jgi:carboxymethylenebutenolidase
MGEFQTIMARDGHQFGVYLAAPAQKPRGAIVVIQEIFGVNHHIRAVTDGYAAEGYVAIAPALFDRAKRGVELGYTGPDMQTGIGLMSQITRDDLVKDLEATLAVVRNAGRIGMVGYCWGGTVTYIAASLLPIACGVSYYGGSIGQNLDLKPQRPVMYHFGEKDSHIPVEAIDKVRAADPTGLFYMYPAGHGFNCTERPDYDPPSAALALERSLGFFAKYVAAAAA